MNTNQQDLCDCRIIHQTKVDRAKTGALSSEIIDQLAQIFKAIADPGRIKILHVLKHDEMCVCDLAAFLGVSESAVSHQLRILRQLQLVANRRDGAVLYYSLNKSIASQLIDLCLRDIEGDNL